MEEKNKHPHGYIYKATNIHNEKVYIGQTESSRWDENTAPIEGRWNEECQEALGKARRGEDLRYIERAIAKYGPEGFKLEQQDIATSPVDLDAKETFWIREYDSLDPEKGYNLKEGGLGGRLSDQAKERLSELITEKWQDPEYREKQLQERRERAQDPNFIDKMTEINRERAQDSNYRDKMSEVMEEKGKDPDYRENVSQGVRDKWQDPKYREKQTKERRERAKDPKWREKMTEINRERAKNPKWREKMRRINRQHAKEIKDNPKFLRDIQSMPKKDVCKAYDMGGKTVNRRIKEILGNYDVNNYTQARNFLEGKDVDQLVKDIQSEKAGNKPHETRVQDRETLMDRKNTNNKPIEDIQIRSDTTLEFSERRP